MSCRKSTGGQQDTCYSRTRSDSFMSAGGMCCRSQLSCAFAEGSVVDLTLPSITSFLDQFVCCLVKLTVFAAVVINSGQ